MEDAEFNKLKRKLKKQKKKRKKQNKKSAKNKNKNTNNYNNKNTNNNTQKHDNDDITNNEYKEDKNVHVLEIDMGEIFKPVDALNDNELLSNEHEEKQSNPNNDKHTPINDKTNESKSNKNKTKTKNKNKHEKKKKKLSVNRKASRCLSQKHGCHFAENLQCSLRANPDTFCPDHPLGLVDHMFASNDPVVHLQLCPKINSSFCQFYTGKSHITSMAYHKYLDRRKAEDKIAWQAVRKTVGGRFTLDLCKAVRGIPRTNGNEVC
eukprot:532175_1